MHRNGIYSNKTLLGSQEIGEGSVSESRMRENRLSGLVGGLLKCYSSNMEGDLP